MHLRRQLREVRLMAGEAYATKQPPGEVGASVSPGKVTPDLAAFVASFSARDVPGRLERGPGHGTAVHEFDFDGHSCAIPTLSSF